jgi:hypothetical protein
MHVAGPSPIAYRISPTMSHTRFRKNSPLMLRRAANEPNVPIRHAGNSRADIQVAGGRAGVPLKHERFWRRIFKFFPLTLSLSKGAEGALQQPDQRSVNHRPAVPSLVVRLLSLALVVLVLACALQGQLHFAAGHAAFGTEHIERAERNAGLLWYGLMIVPLIVLCLLHRNSDLSAWNLSRRATATLLIGFIVLGAALRFHRLDELPPGCWDDEGMNGLAAVSIARSGIPRVVPENDPRPGLAAGFIDLAALVFALVDPDDGPYVLRSVAAALGTIGLAGIAAAAWLLFGKQVALVATAWVAVSQLHVNYSRIGWEQITSSVAEVFVVAGVAAGLRCQGWKSWAGFLTAGLFYGLGLYSYQNYRLFVVLATAVGLVFLVMRWNSVRCYRAQFLSAATLALVVGAPMLWFALNHWSEFSTRGRETIVFSYPDWWEELQRSVPRSLLAFQLIGDGNPRHNLPFSPLLSFVPAMLAPIGVVVCLFRSRQLAYRTVPIWFALGVLPGAITHEAPHASRLLDAITPIAFMVGIAVCFLTALLRHVLPERRTGLLMGLVALMVAAALTAREEYRAYFVERERQEVFYDAFLPYEAVPGRYLEKRRPKETTYLDPKTFWSPTMRFTARRAFADDRSDIRMMRVMHDFPPREPITSDVLYLLPGPYTPMVPAMRAMFPSAEVEHLRDPFGRIDLTVFRVAQQDLNEFTWRVEEGTYGWTFGLRGRFYSSSDGSGHPYYEAVSPFMFGEYEINQPPIGEFGFAVWDGYIELPRTGEYYLRLNPDTTTLTIARREIISDKRERATGGDNEARAVLSAGRWPIQITFRSQPNIPYFLWFFWHPPEEDPEWVRSSALFPP